MEALGNINGIEPREAIRQKNYHGRRRHNEGCDGFVEIIMTFAPVEITR